MSEPNRPPIEGLRVIDSSTVIAGPTIGMLMGDFGADVIKVEHPRGDPLPHRHGERLGRLQEEALKRRRVHLGRVLRALL